MTMPILYVFAGNNGSGKSTLRSLIGDKIGLGINVDPDAIARSIDPVNPENVSLSAGKEATRLIRDCISQRKSFSMEGTMGGKNVTRNIIMAKKECFEVTVFFVGLGDVELNIERVASRVSNGGHSIKETDIRHRETASMNHLLETLPYIDNLVVIDNSNSDGWSVLEASGGQITFIDDNIPAWTNRIVDAFPLTIKRFPGC